MKILVLALITVLFTSFVAAQTQVTWNDFPGASDEVKITNLQNGVRLATNYWAGQACLTDQFSNGLTPANVINWAAWFCSYWGGPNGTNPNCTFYEQNQRTDNSTIKYGFNDLTLSIQQGHFSYKVSNAQNTYFVLSIAEAFQATTGISGVVKSNLISDLFLVAPQNQSSEADYAAPCAAPNVTIPWKVGTVTNNSVAIGSLVSWVWSDGFAHSIDPTASSPLQFNGFGSNSLSLSETTRCAAGTNGNTACNVPSGNNTFSYSKRFSGDVTINYGCAVHPANSGVLIVGKGSQTNPSVVPSSSGSSSTSSTGTANGDGGNGGDGDSASSLQSFLTLLF